MGPLLDWAKKKELLNGVVRFFGFNNPEPSEDKPEYGYEVWLPVDSGIEGSDNINIKQIEGGLYVIRKGKVRGNISGPLNDGEILKESWDNVHKNLGDWADTLGYAYDHDRQWLEEHVVRAEYIGRPFEQDPSFHINIYLPVKAIGVRGQ